MFLALKLKLSCWWRSRTIFLQILETCFRVNGGPSLSELGLNAGKQKPQGANATPAEDKQSQAAAEYTCRAKEIDTELGIPDGEEGPVTAEMRTCGSPPGRVFAPVVGPSQSCPRTCIPR